MEKAADNGRYPPLPRANPSAHPARSRSPCAFCGREMTRAGLSKHLQSCPQRQAATVQAEKSASRASQPLYHLLVKDAHWGNGSPCVKRIAPTTTTTTMAGRSRWSTRPGSVCVATRGQPIRPTKQQADPRFLKG